MRYQGVTVVPGVSRGPLWAPRPSTVQDDAGIEAFEGVRQRFIDDAAALPEDLRAMYELSLIHI